MFKLKPFRSVNRKKLKLFLQRSAIVYLALVLLLHVQQIFFPQQNDFLALAQVFSPYLLLSILIIIPVLFLRGTTVVRVGFAINLLIWILRFGPALPTEAIAADPNTAQIRILDWNVLLFNDTPELVLDRILSSNADVVTLQESNNIWDKYESKLTAIYPYKLASSHTNYGSVLLSKFPILDSGIPAENLEDYNDGVIWARLDLGQGKHAIIATVHPAPAQMCRLLVCYKAQNRDNAILSIKQQVLDLKRFNEPILLAGDFNMTDREPIYRELAASFTDVQKSLGLANLNTWKSSLPILHTFIPVIRIDYMWHTAGIKPLQLDIECADRGSDHCLLQGKMEIK